MNGRAWFQLRGYKCDDRLHFPRQEERLVQHGVGGYPGGYFWIPVCFLRFSNPTAGIPNVQRTGRSTYKHRGDHDLENMAGAGDGVQDAAVQEVVAGPEVDNVAQEQAAAVAPQEIGLPAVAPDDLQGQLARVLDLLIQQSRQLDEQRRQLDEQRRELDEQRRQAAAGDGVQDAAVQEVVAGPEGDNVAQEQAVAVAPQEIGLPAVAPDDLQGQLAGVLDLLNQQSRQLDELPRLRKQLDELRNPSLRELATGLSHMGKMWMRWLHGEQKQKYM